MPVVSYGDAYQLAVQAGATPEEASTLAAIAGAESSYDTAVVSRPNNNGTRDRGLWQINSVHSQYDPDQLVNDPSYNARAALDILRSQGWSAWSAYNNGAYKKFLSGDPNSVALAGITAGATLAAGGSVVDTTKLDSLGSRLAAISDVLGGTVTKQAETKMTPTVAEAITAGATATAGPTAVGQAAIDAAMKAVGVPYVWGGNNLQAGVDCSGLIQQAYKAAGIDIPRVSNDQANAGTPVDFEQAQPGDILWWDYGAGSQVEGADHVAMYLGNGKMIEALHKGLPVHIVDVRKPNGVTRITGSVTPQNPSTVQREVTPDMSLAARLASIQSVLTGNGALV